MNDQQEQTPRSAEEREARRVKKAEEKARRAAEKARNQEIRRQREQDAAVRREELRQQQEAEVSSNFGDLPLVQSNTFQTKTWTDIGQISTKEVGEIVYFRGHLQTVRRLGRNAFLVIRSGIHSIQVVVAMSSNFVSQGMMEYIETALPLESVVEVQGKVIVAPKPIVATTQSNVEIQVQEIHCVQKATPRLPFGMKDACRPEEATENEQEGGENEEKVEEDESENNRSNNNGQSNLLPRVSEDLRLNYRWLDLRTPANQSIFRIQSMVGCLFREFLVQHGFIEIYTPKLLAGASEGGAEVFGLDYFGRPACLAQSPQLHKQISAACAGFERVFEAGPVFRAENSKPKRHLCEFTGLDIEMVIREHYYEILNVLSELFVFIFEGLKQRCGQELELIQAQHPFEPLQYNTTKPSVRLTFAEGCALLCQAGIEQGEYEDLSRYNEQRLGDLVKEKFGTDFFIVDKYPLSARPFYTMPCAENPQLSNSFDFFIRGQEVLSGAQRIHEPQLLRERALACGIPLNSLGAYLESFEHGAQPHGGGGIGLERCVMLYLGLPKILKTSMFPRTPFRLSP